MLEIEEQDDATSISSIHVRNEQDDTMNENLVIHQTALPT